MKLANLPVQTPVDSGEAGTVAGRNNVSRNGGLAHGATKNEMFSEATLAGKVAGRAATTTAAAAGGKDIGVKIRK